MKRKRGHKEGKVKRATAAAENKKVSNVIILDDSSNMDEYGNDEYDSAMEVDMLSSTATQPINVVNINPDGSIDKAAGKLVGQMKGKLKTSKLLDSLHSDADKSSSQWGLERQGEVGERMEDSAIALAEMKMGVLGSAVKQAGSIKIKPSKVLDGSVRKTGNGAVTCADGSYLQEPEMPLVNSQYSKEELDAALSVIKKVMKMDAAEPFNAPMNPEALGISDYLDVIDTPMDFGTICSNLENGDKYMNSEDVYNDVQYIWENCNKYNDNGDYILDLMKCVKKNFMKYWTAAGLYHEQLRGSNGAESIQVEDVAQSSHSKTQVKGQSKRKPGKHHGHHKHNCLCAICVLKRRKREREENARIAKGQIGVIDVQESNQEMLTKGASNDPSSSGNDQGSKKRKTRGPNRLDLNKIEKAKAMGITFNEMGQPFGESSVILSTYIGSITAQMIPITHESWPKVPELLKNTVWETTKMSFGLGEIGKAYTLKAMGNCWRTYKSRITKQIRSVPSGPDANERLLMLKPTNINDEEWNKFINYRLSPEFEEISHRYSKLAKKNATPHTTSRKGLARLREDLRAEKVARNKDPNEVDRVETWIASRKHKDGTPVTKDVGEKIRQMEALHVEFQPSTKNDAVSQVLGKEHRGRVRGMGYGVTPTTVQTSVISKQTNEQLQQQMENVMHAFANLQNLVINRIPDIDPDQVVACFPTIQPTQYSSSSNLVGDKRSAKVLESSPKSFSQASTSRDNGSIMSRKKCKLLDWMGTGKVVAEAEIDCKDPHALVHHLKLGPDHWRVCIKKTMVSMVPLCRPTSEFKTLEDALNSFIAWPTKYIIS